MSNINWNSILFSRKQTAMFFAGFCLTMGSGLAVIPGGETMTLSLN